MLASLADAPLEDPQLVYEPKYDGIRAIAHVSPPERRARNGEVHLWSRLGNEKTAQFPEIAGALSTWAKRLDAPVVLDGEIVALDARGEPTGFQHLQGRIHLSEVDERTIGGGGRTAFIAFDVLKAGASDLRERPLLERRAELEKLFGNTGSSMLRMSELVRGDGRALYRRALDRGWEGLIAKQVDSRYKSGKRTPDWRKLKIVHEQEFVVGGWTEPRQTRSYFGALLLGVYENGRLKYVGHTGTGFNGRELARVMKLLAPLATRVCPFDPCPKTNEKPHWTEPSLVAQIKFTEWTADEKLRHPVYLGLRDDKKPRDVTREKVSRVTEASKTRLSEQEAARPDGHARQPKRSRKAADRPDAVAPAELLDHLRALEDARKDGAIEVDGTRLSVSNLHKVFWPKLKITKGDLLRYYAEISRFILPVVNDRPLTMKRYPNGIAGKPFYQHRAPDDVPRGVRVEHVAGEKTVPSRFVGGSLATLLHMTQLAAISQDPWFSRAASPSVADHAALDLDPSEGVGFARVLDVARFIRDELASIGAEGYPKTSGASGLHIYIPLPRGTPYEAGLIFCQIVATVVAQKHPRVATVERAVAARGKRVYVDYLQNIQGKTLACAYSARASDYAGVSTPLTWDEVDDGVRREDFTLRTLPDRLKKVGDLWTALRTSKGVDLSAVEQYAARARRR